MEQRVPPAAVECDHFVEVGSRQIAIGPRPAETLEERLFLPRLEDARGDDLLRQNVERPGGLRRPVEDPLPHRPKKRGRLHQFIQRERKDPTLGYLAERVARPPDALQKRCD